MKPRVAVKRTLPEAILNALRRARRVGWMGLELLPMHIPPHAVSDLVPCHQTRSLRATFLIATSSGLLLYERGDLHRIIDGYFYGLTTYGRRWYGFHKHVTRYTQRPIGQIVSFELWGSRPREIALEALGLDPSVHQLDAWDDHLYVADTANNRIIRYAIDENRLRHRHDFYPSGELANGEASHNYVHLNSLFSRNGCTYAVYHNHTTKTGRKSQIAILDECLNARRIIDTDAGDAHNVAPHPHGLLYCDSNAGTLVWGEATLECGCFTRGLAVSDQLVLVGGSDFADRDDRDQVTGYVFAFDARNRRPVGEIKLPGGGSVYEIRLIEPVDLAMSGQGGSA